MSASPATTRPPSGSATTTSTPTRNMTGGSLPAMIWQRLMDYAHQNIDLKPIPGIENRSSTRRRRPRPPRPKSARPRRTRTEATRPARGAVGRDDQAAQGNVGALPLGAADRRAAGAEDAVGALTSAASSDPTVRKPVRRRKRLAKPSIAHRAPAVPLALDTNRRVIPSPLHLQPAALHAPNRFPDPGDARDRHRRRRGERLVYAAGAGRHRRGHHRQLDRLSQHGHAGRRPLFQGARRARRHAGARARRRACPSSPTAIPAATRCRANAPT